MTFELGKEAGRLPHDVRAVVARMVDGSRFAEFKAELHAGC